MSLLTRYTKRLAASYIQEEVRSYFVDNISPKDPYMVMLFGGGTRTKAGQYVSEDAALKSAPFFSAVSLIASSIASMPFGIRRKRIIEGKVEPEFYADELFSVCPCPLFTPYTFKEWIIWRTLLKGNAYILIDRNEIGFADALWPLEPDKVRVFIDPLTGYKVYRYTYSKEGVEKYEDYNASDIIHITGFMYDGVVGYGILDFARESIGTGLAVDEFGARFFAGDGQATGIVTHPQRLKKEAKVNIKESYREQSKGVETASNSNGRGVVVLDEGMTFNRTGLSPEEGQFLGTRQFTVEEVCRWFHIPPFMMAVGTTASSLSAEEQYNFFANFGLKPWTDRISQETDIKMLSKEDRKIFASNFDHESLTLLTSDKQLDNFGKARNMGLLTLNNISEKTKTPLMPGGSGDQRIAPSTMKVLGDTDPSAPVPIQVLTGFIDTLRNDRNMTMKAALAIGELLMPTAEPSVIKKIIEPYLGNDDNGNSNNNGRQNGQQGGGSGGSGSAGGGGNGFGGNAAQGNNRNVSGGGAGNQNSG